MPTYEYRCPEGHEFELFQRITDPPEASCPQCGAAAERQLSAGAGLLFKGSGFYITDYRSETYRKAAEAESGGKGPDGTGDGAAGADGKPRGPASSGVRGGPDRGGGKATRGTEGSDGATGGTEGASGGTGDTGGAGAAGASGGGGKPGGTD